MAGGEGVAVGPPGSDGFVQDCWRMLSGCWRRGGVGCPGISHVPSQLEQTLRLETGEREAAESRSLAQHNIELRRLLEEEQAAYKRKLQAYQEGQQRQAQLVQKLQAKVNPSQGTQGHSGDTQTPAPVSPIPSPPPRCCSIRRNVAKWSSSCWRRRRSWSRRG